MNEIPMLGPSVTALDENLPPTYLSSSTYHPHALIQVYDTKNGTQKVAEDPFAVDIALYKNILVVLDEFNRDWPNGNIDFKVHSYNLDTGEKSLFWKGAMIISGMHS